MPPVSMTAPAWRTKLHIFNTSRLKCVSFYFWVMDLVMVIVLLLVGVFSNNISYSHVYKHIQTLRQTFSFNDLTDFIYIFLLNECRFDCILTFKYSNIF